MAGEQAVDEPGVQEAAPRAKIALRHGQAATGCVCGAAAATLTIEARETRGIPRRLFAFP